MGYNNLGLVKSNRRMCADIMVIMLKLKCCGTDSMKDWEQVYKNGTVPYSCCPDNPVGESCSPDKANPNGCLKVLKELLEKNTTLVGGFGLGVAFTQVSCTV